MALPTLRRGGSILPLRRVENQPNGVVRIDPWNDFPAMDRLFDNFMRNPFFVTERNNSNGNSYVESQIELYETESELIAFLYAPGLDASTLDISATSDQLTIKGERKPRLIVEDKTVSHTPWVSSAINTSSFSTSYSLPIEINTENVNAAYKDGVLEVRMPKNEAVKPKQVKVQIGQ